MSTTAIGLITFLCLASGFFLGLGLQYRLPGHHLAQESHAPLRLGAGMVATMSALVLGLLVSSAKSSFDAVNSAIAQNGARIVQLDHLLAQYGTETRAARDQLKSSITGLVQGIWGEASAGSGLKAMEKSTAALDFQSRLRALTPQNDQQKSLLNQCQQITNEIWQNRLLLTEQLQTPVPTVFLVLLIFWLTLLFMSFGLFAARNATVCVVLMICAFSVSSAVFLILEMSHPLDGIIRVSSAPLLKAVELIGQ